MYLAVEGSTPGGYGRDGTEGAALEELERVYSFIYGRVGNRADTEDLTQQVALKALPRLRDGAAAAEVRAYLFATAKCVLATFWAKRYRLPEAELGEDVADCGFGHSVVASEETCAWLEQTLSTLPPHYRTVLELRFLRGCSVREAAREMGKSEGAVKVMQLRALRAAASPH